MLLPAIDHAVQPIAVTRRMSADNVTPLHVAPKTRCATCHLKPHCLTGGMSHGDVDRLDDLLFARRRVQMGQVLFREGDRFQFIYAARSGTFKSEMTLADGREQVTAFHFGGEVMGLDGLAQGMHASSAIALEDAEICAIPYAQLTAIASGNRGMQQALSRLMSREIVREHSLMMMLGSMNAEERLASFLLNISQRLKARGFSPREFHLRMSRAEIGSYLGMKLETVSRTFSAFQKQRILEVDKKHIRINDLEALARAFELDTH